MLPLDLGISGLETPEVPAQDAAQVPSVAAAAGSQEKPSVHKEAPTDTRAKEASPCCEESPFYGKIKDDRLNLGP